MTIAPVLNFAKDAQGTPTYSPKTSNLKYRAALTQNVETNITLPTDYANYNVLFGYSSGANVWVDMTGATATVPLSGTLGTTTADLTPGQRTVPGGSKISIITGDTGGAEFWMGIYGIP
jgi:hypothetical protein